MQLMLAQIFFILIKMNDSLKISQNEDGSFTMDWDKKDPTWSWLNGLTSKEIQVIMEEAIKDKTESL